MVELTGEPVRDCVREPVRDCVREHKSLARRNTGDWRGRHTGLDECKSGKS